MGRNGKRTERGHNPLRKILTSGSSTQQEDTASSSLSATINSGTQSETLTISVSDSTTPAVPVTATQASISSSQTESLTNVVSTGTEGSTTVTGSTQERNDSTSDSKQPDKTTTNKSATDKGPQNEIEDEIRELENEKQQLISDKEQQTEEIDRLNKELDWYTKIQLVFTEVAKPSDDQALKAFNQLKDDQKEKLYEQLSENNANILHNAISNGCDKLAQRLINQKVDLLTQAMDGNYTPYHLAVKQGKYEIVKSGHKKLQEQIDGSEEQNEKKGEILSKIWAPAGDLRRTPLNEILVAEQKNDHIKADNIFDLVSNSEDHQILSNLEKFAEMALEKDKPPQKTESSPDNTPTQPHSALFRAIEYKNKKIASKIIEGLEAKIKNTTISSEQKSNTIRQALEEATEQYNRNILQNSVTRDVPDEVVKKLFVLAENYYPEAISGRDTENHNVFQIAIGKEQSSLMSNLLSQSNLPTAQRVQCEESVEGHKSNYSLLAYYIKQGYADKVQDFLQSLDDKYRLNLLKTNRSEVVTVPTNDQNAQRQVKTMSLLDMAFNEFKFAGNNSQHKANCKTLSKYLVEQKAPVIDYEDFFKNEILSNRFVARKLDVSTDQVQKCLETKMFNVVQQAVTAKSVSDIGLFVEGGIARQVSQQEREAKETLEDAKTIGKEGRPPGNTGGQ